MSEAEYLTLFREYVEMSFMLVGILLSLVSAFLIVSYLAGSKLSRFIASSFLFIYSIAYFWIGSAIINTNSVIAAFGEKMASSEFDFSWAVIDIEQELYIANALVVVSYLTTIAFFVHVRRNRDDV